MPVDPTQPPSTPKNRALGRLRDAVREPVPPERRDAGATTPRGNQRQDDREVDRGREKLSSVLGH
jgi:hypothetical protein